MTRQQELFNYYCLDRIKPIPEMFTVSFREHERIHSIDYKIGLRATIKRMDCFVLYTATDEDLNLITFIPVDTFYDNYDYMCTKVISKDEYVSYIKTMQTINIFEFASLLDFSYIYSDFKEFVEYNWAAIDMDSLIEF